MELCGEVYFCSSRSLGLHLLYCKVMSNRAPKSVVPRFVTWGPRRAAVYEGDEDWQRFLGTLADVIGGCRWICHAYCLTTNHCHLDVETPDGNFLKGMRQLDEVTIQYSNRGH